MSTWCLVLPARLLRRRCAARFTGLTDGKTSGGRQAGRRAQALVFPIRCCLINMDGMVTSPKWSRRRYRVIRDLPTELAATRA
jgi:hypothetical protein